MELANAVLHVLVSIATLISMLAGIGFLVRRIAGLTAVDSPTVLLSIWVGYGMTLAFLQVWHLVWSVNVIAFCVFGCAGISGLVFQRAGILKWLGGIRTMRWPGWVMLILGCVYVLALANASIGQIRNVDTNIYHYVLLRWTTTYAIVPGLANLNARLGFNSSSLLFPALLDSGFWLRSAQHVSSSVLFCALAGQFIFSAHEILTPKLLKKSNVFAVFALGYALHHSYYEATGFSTDMPVFALAAVMFIQTFRILDNEIDDPNEKAFVIAAAIFLAGVAISAKISVSVFAGSTVLIILGTMWKDAANRRMIKISLIMSALCVVTWMIRGAITTGYPVYPLTLGALPVDWRVPNATATVIHHWIIGWARNPFVHWKETLDQSNWIPVWWSQEIAPDFWDFQIPVVLGGVAMMVLAVQRRGLGLSAGLLVLPNIASLVYWFFSAPALRLGAGNIWLLAGTLAALAVAVLAQNGKIILGKALCVVGIVVGLVCAVYDEWIVTEPGPATGFYPTTQISYFKYETDNHVTVLIPHNPGDPKCYDSPLPTTSYPHPNLAMRQSGDLSSGFKVVPFKESTVIGIPP